MTPTPCSAAAPAAARTRFRRFDAPSRASAAARSRDGRIAEPPDRGDRAAGGAGLLERSHGPADDFRPARVGRHHGVEGRRPDRGIRVVEEAYEHLEDR